MAKTPTSTWQDEKYIDFRGKWNSKAEYDEVQMVLDRFAEMRDSRKANCPLTASISQDSTINTSLTKSGGGDWAKVWAEDENTWVMNPVKIFLNRSNLKSPITFAPIEAGMAEFMGNDIKATLTPCYEEDKDKVKRIEYALEDLYNKCDFGPTNWETFHECMLKGSSWTYTTWHEEVRKGEFILNKSERKQNVEESMKTPEGEAQLTARLTEEKKPLTEEKEFVEYDNLALIHPKLEEVYPDPDARYDHGTSYEMVDLAWEQYMSVEQFKANFEKVHDPWVIQKNIKKVKPAIASQADYASIEAFFKAPENIGKQKVQVIRYFNKRTDTYDILANDVLIRKGPLPFNHKQIPFSLHKFINWNGQLYGIGIGRILSGITAEDETLRNMFINQLKLELNPPSIWNDEVFDDIDLQWEEVIPGQKIVAHGQVAGSYEWMKPAPYKPEYQQARNNLREDSIITSGINPIAYSVPKPGEAVRNNMMSLESTLKILKKGVKTWAIGYKNVLRQTIKILQQKLPDSYLKDKEGNEQPREYNTQDVQLSELNGKLNEQVIPGVHSFQMKDEYLDLRGDPGIRIDVDQILPMSMSLKLQRVDKAMAQLMAVFANPQLLDNPAITMLVREYIDLNGLPTAMLDTLQDFNSKEDQKYAREQETAILQGQAVAGIPGMSQAHLLSHTQTIINMLAERDRLTTEGDTGGQIEVLTSSIAEISKHLRMDQLPKNMADKAVAQIADKATQPPPPPEVPPQAGPQASPPPPGLMAGVGGEQAPMNSGNMPVASLSPGANNNTFP